MRVLLWDVHAEWTNSFVRGGHEYLVPVTPDEGGRERPATVAGVPVGRLRYTEVDVIVAQRPVELELARRWLGRRPAIDVPVVYVEHNTPRGSRHPMADRSELRIVHVTHFNQLMWDTGSTPTTVIEHGVVDPGFLYRGELPRVATVIDAPMSRWRLTGADLLGRFAAEAPVDVYGTELDGLRERLGLRPEQLTEAVEPARARLHEQLASRRLYLHTARWTTLGLPLIEAMHLGMPVVAVATTEAVMAVPPSVGVVSTRVDDLVAATRELLADQALAWHMGKQAREFALARYGLPAFLDDWNRILSEVTA